MKAILVIVAKEPVPGKVKTRLCSHLSWSEASELYSLFIQDMVEEMSNLSEHSLALAYTPREAETTFVKMLNRPIRLLPQQGADLGEKLANIFSRMFHEGYEQVHIVNSDSPDLPHSLVRHSIRLLKEPQTEVVLGPCPDGGYYQVGLRRPIPELFKRIPWSTELVLGRTLERARRLGLHWALSGPWYDIDTYEDIRKFLLRHEKEGLEQKGPGWRTLRYIRGTKRLLSS